VSRAFSRLAPPIRLACGGVLLGIAAADGVVDDEELFPILADLDLDTLGAERVAQVAAWVAEPPPLDQVVPPVAAEPLAVRFGLIARMFEIAGADSVISPAEIARLEEAAEGLGIVDDQVAAIRVFVADLVKAASRPEGDPARGGLLAAAAEGLVHVAVPWGAVAFCATAEALGADADHLAPGLGFPPGVSLDLVFGSAAERSAGAAEKRARTRAGLHLLVEALSSHPDPSIAVRRRALARRLKTLE
jgi:hypothetical protein